MSQQQRKDMGVFPDGPKKERMKGKEVNPHAGSFASDTILSKLPGHQPLDSGGVSEKGFQNLRNSSIRKGSI